MSQFWNESKAGKPYPPIQPLSEKPIHTERARPMRTKVTEILGIECALSQLLLAFFHSLCLHDGERVASDIHL
eukprot:SAG31_NODE_12925_length_906_cov_1.002478_1_plen_73_part_00